MFPICTLAPLEYGTDLESWNLLLRASAEKSATTRNGPTQVALSKTIRGALKAGLSVKSVEVGPDGKITLTTANMENAAVQAA